MKKEKLCEELERLKVAIFCIIRVLNGVNEQNLREGGVFWQRDRLRAKYSTVIGPLEPSEFMFLHLVGTLLHMVVFSS